MTSLVHNIIASEATANKADDKCRPFIDIKTTDRLGSEVDIFMYSLEQVAMLATAANHALMLAEELFLTEADNAPI